MSTSQLIDRLAVLIAVVALVAGTAGHQPVIGGAMFWAALLGGWLLRRWARDRER